MRVWPARTLAWWVDRLRFVGQQKLYVLEDELLTAYERFLKNPLKKDPGCEAKTPLCEALRQIQYDDGDFFLAEIHYRQVEPVYGDPIDSAAELRAIFGFALLQLNDSRAMSELVDLLTDPEKMARAGGARAIAHTRDEASALLLRLKTSWVIPSRKCWENVSQGCCGTISIQPSLASLMF